MSPVNVATKQPKSAKGGNASNLLIKSMSTDDYVTRKLIFHYYKKSRNLILYSSETGTPFVS